MLENVVLVKMTEICVTENSKRLKTTLGSCVGLVLHDSRQNRSGLAHIMLPHRTRHDEVVGKYADTAIPALFSRLIQRGSKKTDLQAYLTGGANMFGFSSDTTIATIGEKNVEASKRILSNLQIPIAYEDTGGVQGRTLLFDNRTGEMQVKKLKKIVWRGKGNDRTGSRD